MDLDIINFLKGFHEKGIVACGRICQNYKVLCRSDLIKMMQPVHRFSKSKARRVRYNQLLAIFLIGVTSHSSTMISFLLELEILLNVSKDLKSLFLEQSVEGEGIY